MSNHFPLIPMRTFVASSILLLSTCTLAAATVSMEPRLEAEGSNGNQWLGQSVVIDGDLMVAGAPITKIDDVFGAGKIVVFKRIDGVWVETQQIDVPGARNFGTSVALDQGRLVVGANMSHSPSNQMGQAHLFELQPDGQFTLSQTFTPSNGFAIDRFGTAVAIAGDLIAISAPFSDLEAADAGAVYLYSPGESAWIESGRVFPAKPESSSGFGSTLLFRGDTLLVGSPQAFDAQLTEQGRVDVYRVEGGVQHLQTLLPEAPVGFDFFGSSLAADADRVIVGTYQLQSTEGPVTAGSAYLYQDGVSGLEFSHRFTPPVESAAAAFGYSVALHKQYALITEFGYDDGLFESLGAVHVFVRNANGTWEHSELLTPADRVPGDRFGSALSASDGRLAIGARGVNKGMVSDIGAVYPVHLSPTIYVGSFESER